MDITSAYPATSGRVPPSRTPGMPRLSFVAAHVDQPLPLAPSQANTLGDMDTLGPWEGRAILLVDLDAFFASVEQLDHPEWRGKPVIVGGDPTRRGVVSTASYEARRFGVHSAMPAAQAVRLCPHAFWTNGHYDRYAEVSHQVMDILYEESPSLQQVSIDEAFLDVTPGAHTGEHPLRIADRIRQRVSELGLTCSVGISTSKTVSKIASDMDKPNGLTVVFPGGERRFLAKLPVDKMSGIGGRTASHLKSLGVHTLEDLALLDDISARQIFGINADAVRSRARGEDPVEVGTETHLKSVSNEMTYATDLRDVEEISQAVSTVCARVGRRLRRKGLAGRTITLKVKFDDLSVHTAQRTLPSPVDDEGTFAPIARALLGSVWQPGTALRLIGVGVSGFDQTSEQLDLLSAFEEAEGTGLDQEDEAKGGKEGDTHRHRKGSTASLPASIAHRNLIEATDKVRDRFGDDAVNYGRELRFKGRDTGTMPQKKDESH